MGIKGTHGYEWKVSRCHPGKKNPPWGRIFQVYFGWASSDWPLTPLLSGPIR